MKCFMRMMAVGALCLLLAGVSAAAEGKAAADAAKSGPSTLKSDEEVSPLLGKPAPNVTLNLLDGGKMSVVEKKGKSILLLDFWASWCPPCRIGLPAVVAVADEYKEKGVAFYAVNLGEPAEMVKAFLERMKLKASVALDTDGKAGDLYKAESIPTTVIIGKDGIVQAVHLGLDPSSTSVEDAQQRLKKQLKNDLDALLAGKSLIAKEEKKVEKK